MKNRFYIIYGLAIVGLLSFWGCGSSSFTAPSGSTITVNPSTVSKNISADTTQNITVTVKDSNGNPLNGAEVFISGPFAAPRTVTRYQFYRDTGGNNPVNSGFTGKTDKFGNYYFSIIIPESVGGSHNVFTDNIEFSAGAAYASITLTFS